MVIAVRFHLFPFRTEKLSSLTPMVLRFFRGRVGSRLFKTSPIGLVFFLSKSQPFWDIARSYPSGLWLNDVAGPPTVCYPSIKSLFSRGLQPPLAVSSSLSDQSRRFFIIHHPKTYSPHSAYTLYIIYRYSVWGRAEEAVCPTYRTFFLGIVGTVRWVIIRCKFVIS